MPRNGSGSFSLVSGNPVVPSTVISSTWANSTLNDIASGLTQSLSSDGQTTPVANLPMATFRHTNVGNAIARNEYAAYGQVQDGQPSWASVAGADTIVATIAPGPTSYTTGQLFRFIAAGNNTAAVTFNLNGLGAKNVTKGGASALQPGDLRSGAIVVVQYDGTQFQIISTSLPNVAVVGTARNIRMVVAAASASATLTATEIIVETAIGGVAYRLSNFSSVINLATTGAGGMDTGTAPVSGFVAVYAIYNPTTGTSALLATNATAVTPGEVYGGANMPAGYTASALVSTWATNASSQFTVGGQIDRRISIPLLTALSTNTQQVSPTAVPLTTIVPRNATHVSGLVSAFTNAAATSSTIDLYSSTTSIGRQSFQLFQETASQGNLTNYNDLSIFTMQTIYYAAATGAGTPIFVIYVSSYTF